MTSIVLFALRTNKSTDFMRLDISNKHTATFIDKSKWHTTWKLTIEVKSLTICVELYIISITSIFNVNDA